MNLLLLLILAAAPEPVATAHALTAGHHLLPPRALVLAKEPEVARAIAATALDDKATTSSRVRAIHLLGLAPKTIALPTWRRLIDQPSSLIRVEAIWARGLATRDLKAARRLLKDRDPRVRRVAERLLLRGRKLEQVPEGGGR